MLFLKAFALETNLLVKLGDFLVKKRKIWKKNVYLTENQLSRKKMSASHHAHWTTLLKDQLFTSLLTRVHPWILLSARVETFVNVVIGKDLAYEWVTSL